MLSFRCLLIGLLMCHGGLGSLEVFSANRENILRQDAGTCKGAIKFSFKCVKNGDTYDPDPSTTCVCQGFLSACCTSRNPTTTRSTVLPSTSTRTVTTTKTPTTTPTPYPTGSDPLDPLTADEITSTSQIIENYSAASRAEPTRRFIYNWITLKEPPKDVLLPFFLSNKDPPADVYPRKSFSVLIERSSGNVFEAVVNLKTKKVESLVQVHNVQPSLSPEDLLRAEVITRSDATVQKRCASLGFPDMDLVYADPWSMGYVGDRPEYQGKRLVQLYVYGKHSIDDNHYAHPFDFLPIVDLIQGVVIGIEELPTHDDFDAGNKVGNVVPHAEANYDYKLRGGAKFLRQDDKPIKVESPQGASYVVKGNQIQWQKWKMRVSFNGREGMVIHTVSYNDNATVRPVLYRASLAEMFIPYGDPRPPYHRKAVFDLGEYGIGFNADRQVLNQDVVGAVVFIDGVLNNSTGDPVSYPRIITIREEDAGILWKHVDFRTGKGVVTRSHRLVLSFIATVGNYEYIFMWQFYQDGTIQLQIQLTGIISSNMLAQGATPAGYGSLVASQIDGQYHQHFFAVRLDTEIDGNPNSVYTSDAVSVSDPTGSPGNPYGQGFTTKKTELKTAATARTKIDPLSGRVWVVNNPTMAHPYTGQAKGWKLVPPNTPPLMMKENSPLRPKASFLDYDVWVLPYAEDQLFPGGFYLNNSGLTEWVGRNPDASVENRDIVLFHMFGLTHIPRVEDWPVMPVEHTGFSFKPYNFFLENPAIDVPPPSSRYKKSEL
ncbi:peroxisomal primary amine oxidase isoform X1 [Folsomia candida]|uniref:peroxisomal primary amine oxidase isoform X1 n=1 Tax=Folsomia candida TaxID=158441 RepID=UPI000B8F5AB2|nr:peroxisomal primary amine oxidase isoform X1 [Folsomia candida]